jgi:hypothetical protein
METAMISEVRDTFAPAQLHFGKFWRRTFPKAFALNPQFGKNARHSKFLPVA